MTPPRLTGSGYTRTSVATRAGRPSRPIGQKRWTRRSRFRAGREAPRHPAGLGELLSRDGSRNQPRRGWPDHRSTIRGRVTARPGYFGALQLAESVRQRFRPPAGGGRARDRGWTMKRLIPVRPETLARLERSGRAPDRARPRVFDRRRTGEPGRGQTPDFSGDHAAGRGALPDRGRHLHRTGPAAACGAPGRAAEAVGGDAPRSYRTSTNRSPRERFRLPELKAALARRTTRRPP